jgi:hypothetical protein
MNKRIFPIPSAYWRIEVLTIQERADIPLTRRDVALAVGHVTLNSVPQWGHSIVEPSSEKLISTRSPQWGHVQYVMAPPPAAEWLLSISERPHNRSDLHNPRFVLLPLMLE